MSLSLFNPLQKLGNLIYFIIFKLNMVKLMI